MYLLGCLFPLTVWVGLDSNQRQPLKTQGSHQLQQSVSTWPEKNAGPNCAYPSPQPKFRYLFQHRGFDQASSRLCRLGTSIADHLASAHFDDAGGLKSSTISWWEMGARSKSSLTEAFKFNLWSRVQGLVLISTYQGTNWGWLTSSFGRK